MQITHRERQANLTTRYTGAQVVDIDVHEFANALADEFAVEVYTGSLDGKTPVEFVFDIDDQVVALYSWKGSHLNNHLHIATVPPVDDVFTKIDTLLAVLEVSGRVVNNR